MRPGLRPLLVLAALVAVGAALPWLIGRAAPIGIDLSDRAFTADMLAAPGFPAHGPADADLTVLVFTDYDCGACRKAAPELERAAARDGKVRLVYRDWPVLGPRSVHAARIALAAREEADYHRLHNVLMAAPGLDEASLRAAVKAAGGDWEAARAGAGAEDVDALLERTARDAFQLGLAGTPGYLVGPHLLIGAHDEREFRRAFEQARNGP